MFIASFEGIVSFLCGWPDSWREVCPRTHRLATALTLLAVVAGCDSLDYEVVPVSGVVTLDGKPLTGALVNTQPIAGDKNPNPGSGSFAKTDESGSFSLELVSPIKPGAVVGTHRVRISKVTLRYATGREDAPTIVRNPLPQSASDGSLRLTVPSEGTDNARFDIVSKKSR